VLCVVKQYIVESVVPATTGGRYPTSGGAVNSCTGSGVIEFVEWHSRCTVPFLMPVK
jgi:hypothetical protein